MKYLRSGVDSKVIGYDTTSVELLKEAFPSDMQEDLVDNFNQYSIDWKKDNISEDEIHTIKSMIVDRFDNNSLVRLNSSRFYEHPLMLEESVAIIHHMGWSDDHTDAKTISEIFNRYPLAMYLHLADVLATFKDEQILDTSISSKEYFLTSFKKVS